MYVYVVCCDDVGWYWLVVVMCCVCDYLFVVEGCIGCVDD